jgi:formylglycine-generating enzyme required for sulfatase activity
MRSVWLVFLAACAAPQQKSEAPLIPLGKNVQGAEEFLRVKDGMVVILIPKGEFVLGDDIGDPEERPARKFTLDAFLIDKYEVTNEQFAKFLNDIGTEKDEKGRLLHDGNVLRLEKVNGRWRPVAGRERHPAVTATWWGAEAYAKWVGGRIPTAREWEKAGRGCDGRKFPWGNEPPDSTLCNFAPSDVRDTVPVGSYPRGASPYGCMEMAGNAYERVYGGTSGGMRPSTVKGGCYLSMIPFQMRPADLCGYNTDKSGPWVAFRCAMNR